MKLKLPVILLFIFCITLSLWGITAKESKQEEPVKKTSLINEFGKPAGSVDLPVYFREVPLENLRISLNSTALKGQIEALLDYSGRFKSKDPLAVHAGIFSGMGIKLADVERTMRFIRDVLEEDMKKGGRQRLGDPLFVSKHFRILRWYPCHKQKDAGRKIRLTKYAVFTINGSPTETELYNCALYRLPDDEKGVSLREAKALKQRLSRYKYTKQQVLAGVYRNGGASPLVWVTRNGLDEALMEGSICVRFPGGEKKYYNVDRNNGIAYEPTIKNPAKQKRYWYFGEVSRPLGYGLDVRSQVPLFPGAAFAGDVYNLGLGKVLGVVYKDHGCATCPKTLHLGILADTGGAFSPNLNQLDYYAGVFENRKQFKNKTAHIPAYAEVYILMEK
ncbi:MAG: hypothetical protein GY765_30400 [bacterium]|nr:hypothetical protein [bacterium]